MQWADVWGLPDSSVGKESTCNAGDPSLIPGSGRSAGEGIGYLLQYSNASLVAQLVNNLPAMQETWIWSLGWKDPLKEGMATHSNILLWRIPRTEEPGGLQSMGRKESDTTEHAHTQWWMLTKPPDWMYQPGSGDGKEEAIRNQLGGLHGKSWKQRNWKCAFLDVKVERYWQKKWIPIISTVIDKLIG